MPLFFGVKRPYTAVIGGRQMGGRVVIGRASPDVSVMGDGCFQRCIRARVEIRGGESDVSQRRGAESVLIAPVVADQTAPPIFTAVIAKSLARPQLRHQQIVIPQIGEQVARMTLSAVDRRVVLAKKEQCALFCFGRKCV